MIDVQRSGTRASAWSPYADRPCGGLIPIYIRVEREETCAPIPATLTMRSAPADLYYEKQITLGAGSAEFCISINSHMLVNGELELNCSLVDSSDNAIWSGSLRFILDNAGTLADRVRASLIRHGTPLIVDGVCDSRQYDYADISLQPWFDRTDAQLHIDSLAADTRITHDEKTALENFVREGYMVLAAPVEESLLTKINEELEDAMRRKIQGYEYGSSQRIPNLHLTYAGIRALWIHPTIMRYLQLIFDSEPRPCQTLTYMFGSQQDPHQDTVHLTPFPAGYMCGVWVALEDVRENCGELVVYPGSHRMPRVYMSDTDCPKVTGTDWSEFGSKVVPRWQQLLHQGGFEKLTYRPKRGTVLIWHENLMHGGSIRLDTSLSRRSIVSHNFASGAIAFYDSTGTPGYMEPSDGLH
jgi:hypothetical protein